jgi:hypothetical protein
MEDLYSELARNLNSGAAVSISQYLRNFEELEYTSESSKESFIFHLFACYITNNLVHGKLLWKRIPSSQKTPGELEKVWLIGKSLLQNQIPAALKTINTTHWMVSEHIVKILKSKLIEDTKKQIESSYISIELQILSEYLASSKQEVLDYIKKWGWRVDGDFVYPTQNRQKTTRVVEDHDIYVVTQLVNYLEQKIHLGLNN